MKRFTSKVHVTLVHLITGVTVAYAVVLYARLVAGVLAGDGWWMMALANTFALYLFVPLPLFALTAILTRRRPAVLAVLAVVALFTSQYGALFVPPALRGQSAAASALRIMTFNIPFPEYGGDEQTLVDHILAQKADIVFTQELTSRGIRVLQGRLRTTYPYIESDLSGLPFEGKLILSRYPLRTEKIIEDTAQDRSTQVVVATIDGHEVVLVNMHPTSTYGVARLSDMPHAVNSTYALRERQIADVIAYLVTETRPIVIAGDMNTTDQTKAYRLLTARYRDSWREAGFGFGLTFPSPLSHISDIQSPLRKLLKTRGGALDQPMSAGLLRLDHILHTDHFRAIEAQTVVIGQSDHIAVVSDLVWAE